MKRLALLAIIFGIWLCAPAHAQFNGCSSFCGTSSSAVVDNPGFNNNQGSGGGSTLACTYTPVTTGTQNVAYTGATPSASGGVPAYTFSETGALPSGLTISSSTGVISGTPTVSGTFTGIQVKVADTVPTTVNCGASFTLVIALPANSLLSQIGVCILAQAGFCIKVQ
jgi:hypothetical protein